MEYKELIRLISENTGISVLKVKDVLEEMNDIIFEELKKGETVKLGRIGNFKAGKRKGRWDENGFIPEYPSPLFIASRRFRAFLRKGDKK